MDVSPLPGPGKLRRIPDAEGSLNMELLPMTRRFTVLLLLALCAGAAALITSAAGSARPVAHAAFAQQCPERYPATRDPANPLDLKTAPGANPLQGASFFVPGPNEGNAASAIASLVG